MKTILQSIIINSVAIAVTAIFLPSIDYNQSLATLILSAIVLGIGNTFIKPVVSLILLPVSIITLGLAGWLINALILLITTLLVPSFNIQPFNFQWSGGAMTINLFWSYIITGFVLNLVIRVIQSVLRNN